MRKTLSIFLFCFSIAALLAVNTAISEAAIVINFDELVGGTTLDTGDVVTNQYAPLGVTFVNPDFLSHANKSISSLFPGHSVPNLLFVFQRDDVGHVHGRPEEIIFSSPMSQVSMLFETSNSASITMLAFSPAGDLLESVTMRGSVNDPLNLLPRVGTIGLTEPSGIGWVELYSRFQGQTIDDQSLNFGIDDLTLTSLAPEASALAIWSVLGTVGLLFARRRFAK